MELTFKNAAGATLTAELEPEMTVDEIIQELIANGFIPNDNSGFHNPYALFSSGHGRISGQQAIGSSGFCDGDTVTVAWSVLYGCPNAKTIPGVLPDFMMTAFDDFESFEL